MILLKNLSRELINISFDNIENSTIFLDKESILFTNEQRINIIIDILFNFIVKKRDIIKDKIDDSIHHNLCYYYINYQNINKDNRDKIIQILKKNEKELKGDIKNVYEIIIQTNKIEKSNSDKEKILSMIDIEKKIKDGFELNANTSHVLNTILDRKDNNEIMNQTISLINTNVINNQKIDINLSEKLVNMFLDENIKLDKIVFDNLVMCLMNIIKNCKLDEQLGTALYNNLLNLKEKKLLNKLELIVISLKILTQKHYSFNKNQILNCLHLLANEKIIKSNPLFFELENIILNSFNNQNLDKEIFNSLFELLYKNIDLLNCISLCLLNSLENKKKEEINILVNWNLKKFEDLIFNDHINSIMIDILCKASFDILSDSKFLTAFVFFTIKLKELKNNDYIDALSTLVSENKIKICEYHIKIIEKILDINGIFLLLIKIIEIDKIDLLTKIDVNKIIINLYYDFKNGINLLYKMIKCKVYFNDESLVQLSNYLYNNHKEDEQNKIYLHIKQLFFEISSIQKKNTENSSR